MPENNIMQCARYAYRPNKLKYCGPDKNQELLEVMNAGAEPETKNILENFECLYPNLRYIAGRMRSADPLAASRAYWVGNDILKNTGGAKLYEHLAEKFFVAKKFSNAELGKLKAKIFAGANEHHSFHVFNVWQNPQAAENPHVLYSMDECRVGWGQVRNIKNNIIAVLYEPIVYNNGRMMFGAPVLKKIFRELPGEVKIGDWISFHWSSFCEVLSPENLMNLRKWTAINLELANL